MWAARCRASLPHALPGALLPSICVCPQYYIKKCPFLRPTDCKLGVGSSLMCHCAAGGPGPVMSVAPSRPPKSVFVICLIVFRTKKEFCNEWWGKCDGGRTASGLSPQSGYYAIMITDCPRPFCACASHPYTGCLCVCNITWPRVRDDSQLLLLLLHLTPRPTLV